MLLTHLLHLMQRDVLASMARFFGLAFFSDPKPRFSDLDFDTMRRYNTWWQLP